MLPTPTVRGLCPPCLHVVEAIDWRGLEECLERHDNVRLRYAPGPFGRKGWITLQIGVRTVVKLAKLHKMQWAEYESHQRVHPVRLANVKNRTYWWFQDQFYSENEGSPGAAVYALIVTRKQRQAQRIDRAQQMVAMGSTPRSAPLRGNIPDDVKHFVWTRDRGSCRNCGATAELQFDHIIPISMGGSSTPRTCRCSAAPMQPSKSRRDHFALGERFEA